MRILHVEDDRATAQSVELMMKSEGFNVYTTDLGEEGADLAKIYDYDLILLDIGLPDISGLEVLRRIRLAQVKTPVMMVSGCSEIETKVKTFGLGADDYLQKPFHKDELIARVHAIVRRSKGHAHAVINVGPIAVNLDTKSVTVAGKPIPLTGKEYQMLELLALRLGSTITKDAFLNHLYGGMDEPETKIIDVFICKLRAKLRKAGAAGHIRTVWGRGYVLSEEAGEDREQKKGTPDSLAGRALSCLAGGLRTTIEVAEILQIEPHSARATLKRLSEKGWARAQGNYHAPAWSITRSGEAEHKSRAALAAVA